MISWCIQLLLLSPLDNFLWSNFSILCVLFWSLLLFLSCFRAEIHGLLFAFLSFPILNLRQTRIQEFEDFRTSYGLDQIDLSSLYLIIGHVQGLQHRTFKQLGSGWPHLFVYSQTHTNESLQFLRVLGGYFRVLSFCYLSVKRREVTGLKGYFQRAELIDQASQRPNVAFIAIFLSRPDLRACIVRGSSLCWAKSILCNFGYIHIS